MNLLGVCCVSLLMFVGSIASVWAQSPNWSGPYLGAGVGAYHGQNEWRFESPPSHGALNFSGTVYGGHLGYQFQQDKLVFGAEASILGGGFSGDLICPSGGTSICKNEFNQLLTLSGRLGMPVGNFLPYASVGFARLQLQATRLEAATGPSDVADLQSGRGAHNGFTLGGGIDYALSSLVSVGLDARYYWFESKQYLLYGAYSQSVATIRPDPAVIMMRLSIRFGDPQIVSYQSTPVAYNQE